MKKLVILILITLSMSLVGCGLGKVAWNLNDVTYEEIQEKLIKGQTTKEEVLKYFDKPSNHNITNGKEIWTYNMTLFLPVLGMSEYRNLTIEFDGDVVSDYTYSSGG